MKIKTHKSFAKQSKLKQSLIPNPQSLIIKPFRHHID